MSLMISAAVYAFVAMRAVDVVSAPASMNDRFRGNFPSASALDPSLQAAARGMEISQFLLAHELLRLVAVREVQSSACPDGNGEGVDLYIISKEWQAKTYLRDWSSSVSWRGYASGLCGTLGVPVRRVVVVRRMCYSPPLQRVGWGRSHAAAVADFLLQGYIDRRENSDGYELIQASPAALVIEEGLEFRSDVSANGRSVLQRALRDALPSSKSDAKQFGLLVNCNPTIMGAMGSRSFTACYREDAVDLNLHDYGILNVFDYSHRNPAFEDPYAHDVPARVIDIGRETNVTSLNASDFVVSYAVRRQFAAEMLFGLLLEWCVVFERFDLSEQQALQVRHEIENRWRTIVLPTTLRVHGQKLLIPSLTRLVGPNNKWCSLSEPVFVAQSDSEEARTPPHQKEEKTEQMVGITAGADSHGNGHVASESWKNIFLIAMDDLSYEYVYENDGQTVRLPAIDWVAVQRLHVRLNHGYRVQLLTETDAEDFVALSFPQYLDLYARMGTWRSRVVLLRYLLLYEFGGIIIDSAFKPVLSFDEILHLVNDLFSSYIRTRDSRSSGRSADHAAGDKISVSATDRVTEVFVKSTSELRELVPGFMISTRPRNPMFLRLADRMAGLLLSDPSGFSRSLGDAPDYASLDAVLAKILYAEVHAVYGDAIHGEALNHSSASPYSYDRTVLDAAFDSDPCFTARRRGYSDMPCNFAATTALSSSSSSSSRSGGGSSDGKSRSGMGESDITASSAYFMLEQRVSASEEVYAIMADTSLPVAFSKGRRNWPPRVGDDPMMFTIEV